MTTAAATLTLWADPRSPRLAREFVEETLRSWGLVAAVNDAKLLTSELVTNGVLHARTGLVLTVARDDERGVVRVSVHDDSAAVPRRRTYSALATTGRGLNMIGAAADAYGVDAAPAGKDVWFEIAMSPADNPLATEHR